MDKRIHDNNAQIIAEFGGALAELHIPEDHLPNIRFVLFCGQIFERTDAVSVPATFREINSKHVCKLQVPGI
jgi:hypothetical protein